MDDCEDIIPEYLNFVRGIVDSEDLPLNISRETLQQNKILKVIRKNLSRSLDLFTEVLRTRTFNKFYEAVRQEHQVGYPRGRPKPQQGLLSSFDFTSTKRQMRQTSLKGKQHHSHCYDARLTLRGAFADYITRMPEVQHSIYYLTGESLHLSAILRSSRFQEEGFETLLLVDPIDEYAITQLKEFDAGSSSA